MKRKSLVFNPSLHLSLTVAGIALSFTACGSDGSDATNTMTSSSVSTTAPVATVPPVTPPPTTPAPNVPSVPPVTPSVTPPPAGVTPPAPPTTPAPASSGADTSSETGSAADSSDVSAGDTSGAAEVSSSAPSNSADTNGEDSSGAPGGDEDFDPKPEDFACISDWEQIYGFRIHNFLGHTEEAKAVANNPAGGVYPVGTILQHLPTEAMVKRRAGFSPATKDWEFFLLTLSPDGTTTISERGPDIATAQGQTCESCHVKADAAFDFVCNTWAENGGAGNCGFDFMQSFLDTQLASDTRCE